MCQRKEKLGVGFCPVCDCNLKTEEIKGEDWVVCTSPFCDFDSFLCGNEDID